MEGKQPNIRKKLSYNHIVAHSPFCVFTLFTAEGGRYLIRQYLTERNKVFLKT